MEIIEKKWVEVILYIMTIKIDERNIIYGCSWRAMDKIKMPESQKKTVENIRTLLKTILLIMQKMSLKYNQEKRLPK